MNTRMKAVMKNRIFRILLTVSLIGTTSCMKQVTKKITEVRDYKTVDTRSPFLKVHMQSGNLYILSGWTIDAKTGYVEGRGNMYDAYRNFIRQDEFAIAMDSVAIFETNVVQPSGAATALTIITGVSVAITIACALNTKACFGSCPTFYSIKDGESRLEAEGFSSSIAPALEAADIDVLRVSEITDGTLTLEMRNEALETHVVRHADLLVIPRKTGKEVFKDMHGKFWQTTQIIEPTTCRGPEGDCTDLIRQRDGVERISLSDSFDLRTKEMMELTFDNPSKGKLGLVISTRQSLLTTFLLYQTFAYMGSDIGKVLAGIENHRKSSAGLANILGGVKVFARVPGGDWMFAGEVGEHGPLASDSYLIALPDLQYDRSVRIRLELTKGNWRLDQIGMVALEKETSPKVIKPVAIYRNEIEDREALGRLLDSTRALTTMPGDTYLIKYRVQGDSNTHAFYLKSRGYYLEWMREEWLMEKNEDMLGEMLFNTQYALKRLAPQFKKVEEKMEQTFLRSKYAKP